MTNDDMDLDVARAKMLAVAQAKIARVLALGGTYFVCPDCCRFTPHPDDVANSYCPSCHAFKNESYLRSRCFEPSCPAFGDHDFGEATCPEEHATPPAHRSEEK